MEYLQKREQFNANRDSLSYPEIPDSTEFQNQRYGYEASITVHGWNGFTWPKL